MKKFFIIMAAVALLLTSLAFFNHKNSIIVYSSMEQYRNDSMQAKLDEQFPDWSIRVVYMPTAKVGAKVSLEGFTTDADIIVGVDTAYLQKAEEYFADVREFSHLQYADGMQVESGKYLIWERAAATMIVNTEILEKYNLDKPKTLQDLLNPIYKNRIAMSDPKTSGTGFMFLKGMINAYGEDAAFDYFDALAENVKQFTESGSGPVKLLKQGEIAVGFGLTYQAVTEMNKGNPFELIEPEIGMPYMVTGTTMIEGRQKDSRKAAVFEYLVNDYLLYDKKYANPELVVEGQENALENYPKVHKYADMTDGDDIQERERLLEKWKY